MICDGVYDTNVDTNNILSLLAEWYEEYFIDTPSTLLMREYYDIKYKRHDLDTPKYMEALSGEHSDE